MTTAVLLAIFVAIVAVAAAVYFYKQGKEAETKRLENEALVADWLEANTMLHHSAFESFRALFRASRRW